MQTSSIMLDSALGKILTADEVDKSVQTKNSDANETTTTTTTTTTTDSNKGQTSTVSTEAEVRLVFRFTVEEQLVYNGKIEKVQQLQSEEFSRLVSRIAWDGAKEAENKLLLEKDDMIDSKHSNVDSKKSEECHLKSLSTQTNETSFSSKVPFSEDYSKNTTEEDSEFLIPKEKTITCNNQSSDHEAYVRSKNPTQEQNSENCSLAQVVKLQAPITTCDNNYNFEHFSNHIQEVDQEEQQPTSQQELQQENDLSKTTADKDTSLRNNVFNTQQETEQTQQTLNEETIDSQSIADTIKECVNSVDLEFSRKTFDEINSSDMTANELSTESIILEKVVDYPEHDEQMIEIEILEHNVSNDSKRNETGKLDMVISNEIHTTETESACNRLNCENETLPIILEQKSSEAIKTDKNNDNINTQTFYKVTHHYEKDSTTSRTPATSGKRKATSDHNSNGKRIRKSTSKDQRNLITRKSTSKAIGNLKQARQNNSISPTSNNNNNINSNNYFHLQSNSSEDQQQLHHTNKIFAKWTDNHYYPGTILRPAKDRKFVIGFFDGAQRNVAEIDLIPLCNIEGRQVRVSIAKNYCVNALVYQQSSAINDQPMFDVEYQQEGIVRKSVPFKDIFLTGDQGSLLINQVDRNSGASNFADVDLDNIIYEKRSRRFQDMEDYELTENTSLTSKRKRGQYMRNSRAKTSTISPDSPAPVQTKRNSQCDNTNHDSESTGGSPDVLKTNFLCPNSNPPSESSSSTGSSNVPNVAELGQEFYFASSSPHRTKTSLLL